MSARRKLMEAVPPELRVDRVLPKPFDLEDLIAAIAEVVAYAIAHTTFAGFPAIEPKRRAGMVRFGGNTDTPCRRS
jgi:hypothetical protein